MDTADRRVVEKHQELAVVKTLLRCPYGHDASFDVTHIERGSYGTERPLGLRCGQCGRVFVKEFQMINDRLDAWGPVVSSHIWSSPMYELHGPWQGQGLTLVTVQE